MGRVINPNANRGLATQFFQEVVRRGHARIKPGTPIADSLIFNRGKNTAYEFANLLKSTDPNFRWRLGVDVDLEDIKAVWDDHRAGKTLPPAIKGTTLVANGGNTGNAANGNNGQPNSGSTPSTSTTPAEAVPPVTPNIHQAAYRVFEKLRTKAITPPASVNDAYRLLWDDLDPTVRAGKVSGVLSDAMARLFSEDRVLFNGVFTLLPEPAREAIEEALLETKPETFYGSLGRTVEQVFHIDRSVGGRPGYAADYFHRWNAQIETHLRYLTVDAPAGHEPSDAERAEASRIHSMIAFRDVEEGLRKEVAAQAPAPPPDVEDIQFNTVLPVLLAKLSQERFRIIADAWGVMPPADKHTFMASLDKEQAAAEETSESTEVVPVEGAAAEPPAETPAEPPASGGRQPGNRNRPTGPA